MVDRKTWMRFSFAALTVCVLAGGLEFVGRRVPRWVGGTPVRVDGASEAYAWQGAVHAYDRDGFRRLNGPFPPKGDRQRVIAVGDSYTVGMGVEVADAWPAQLAAITGDEVLNLGRYGAQSATIASVMHRSFYQSRDTALVGDEVIDVGPPRMRWGDLCPDVVVYAVCTNDADPADNYCFPGCRWIGSSVGLLRLGYMLRPSSRHQSLWLGDFDRFERDVASMRADAQAHRSRFVVAVFDNFGFADLVSRLEDRIRRAGVEPVPFRLPAGSWIVAPDEQHPNAAAHRLFAEAVARSL